MAQRPNPNDISIGKDAWITFSNLDGGQSCAVQIDSELASVMPLIESLETECVAECCGLDAFALWPEDIEKAMAKFNRHELSTFAANIACAQQKIDELPSDIVVSIRLNQYLRKVVLLEVLAHIRAVVEGIDSSHSRLLTPEA